MKRERLPKSKSAKHAEIARRYAWKARQQQQPKHVRLAAIDRAQIRRLFRHRLGNHAVLDQRIMDALGEDWQSCCSIEIAHRAGLKLQERMLLGITRFPATDVPPAQAKAMYAARRREADRERKREIRRRTMEAKAMSRDLSERQESLFYFTMASGRWMKVADIAKAVRDFAAWRRPDGSRLTEASLRTRIHEELNRLEAEGLIQQKKQPGGRGFNRVVRACIDTSVQKTRPQPHRPAKNGHFLKAPSKDIPMSASVLNTGLRTRVERPSSGLPGTGDSARPSAIARCGTAAGWKQSS
jgi:hypothetical protein